MIDEDLVRRLPLPLAQLYRRAHNAKTPLERHQAAYFLWEAALKLLGSVAVIEYAQLKDVDEQLAERLQNLARPAVGHWWEFVRRLMPVLAERGDGAFENLRDLVLGRARDDLPRTAGLDAALTETLEGQGGARSTVRLSELFERLVRYRNREVGHGAAGQRPADFYDKLGRALLAGVAELLGKLDVLAGRRLLYIADVRRQASGDWLIERYELIGETARRIESLELPESDRIHSLLPERVYLEATSSEAGPATEPILTGPQLRSLHPLVIFDADPGEVLFLNARRGRQRAEYLCYSSGRVLDRRELAGEQRELLARILDFSVDSNTADEWAARSHAEVEQTSASAEAAAPPSRRVGEFELLSTLGRGGMGVVYRAWQPSLGRQVALKCLLRSGDPKAEARFAREIRALGRVEHPHVVKIFTSGSEGDQWFYAMELVEGATLAAVCDKLESRNSNVAGLDLNTWRETLGTVCEETRKAEKPISDTQGEVFQPRRWHSELSAGQQQLPGRSYVRHIVELVRQVAEAAHALHEAGIIHRDIKLGNILVSPDGAQAVLMDLGLAQLADDVQGRLTRTRQFIGTLRYASPEQVLSAGRLDRRSDVYSLGATLWELLTLRPIYGATEEVPTPEVMQRIQFKEPERIRKYHPGFSADLEAIVLKCLEKDPDRRYVSTRELVDELNRFLAGEPVQARPIGEIARAWRWCRRNRLVAASIAGATIALVSITIISILFAAHQTDTAHRLANAADDLRQEQERTEAEKKEADRQRDVADQERALARKRLVQQYIANGVRLQDQDDISGSLVWFAEALKEAEGDSELEQNLRVHLGIGFRLLPRLVGIWPSSAPQPYPPYVVLDKRRLWLETGDSDQIWDMFSTELISRRSRRGPKENCQAFSHDGRFAVFVNVASQDKDCEVSVWDTLKGRSTLTLRTRKTFDCANFSYDNRLVAIACYDGRENRAEFGIWQTDTGRPVMPALQYEGWIERIVFSRDGHHFVFLGEETAPRNGQSFQTLINQSEKTAQKRAPSAWARTSELQIRSLATGRLVGRAMKFNVPAADVRVGMTPSPNRALERSDKGVRLWDLTTGQPLTEYIEHHYYVERRSLLSDSGKRFLTASQSGVRVWDTLTGEPVCQELKHDIPRQAEFSPDENRLVTVDHRWMVRVWNLSRAWPGELPHAEQVMDASFTGDGGTLVIKCSDGKIHLYNTQTHDPVMLPINHVIASPAQFTSNGHGLVSYCPEPSQVWLWDFATFHEAKLPAGGIPRSRLTPGGRHVVAPGHEDVRVYDTFTGAELTPPIKEKRLQSATLSQNGNRMITITGDDRLRPAQARTERAARLWDASTGQLITILGKSGDGEVLHARFSTDGRYVLTRTKQEARLLDANTGQLIAVLGGKSDGDIFTADFTTECRYVLTQHRRVNKSRVRETTRLWEGNTGQPLAFTVNHDYEKRDKAPQSSLARVNSAGTQVLTFDPSGEIRIWNMATASLAGPVLRHPSSLVSSDAASGFLAAGFSPDGARFFTVSRGLVQIWNSKTLQPTCSFTTDNADDTVEFSPDGKLVVTSQWGHPKRSKIRVWSAATGKPVAPPLAGVRFLGFSPDSRRFVTVNDRFVRKAGTPVFDVQMWDAYSGLPLGPPIKHPSDVADVEFTSDGRAICTLCNNGSVRVWQVAPDERPADHLRQLASLVAGRRLGPSYTLLPIDPNELHAMWKIMRAKDPQTFAVDPNDALAWHRRHANECERRSNWSGALFHLKSLIEGESANGTHYARRAECYRRLGRFSEAVIDYSRVIEAEPTQSPHYVGRGQAFQGLKKAAEAYADFSKAIELNPNNWKARLELGRYYVNRAAELADAGHDGIFEREWDKGAAEFDKVLQLGGAQSQNWETAAAFNIASWRVVSRRNCTSKYRQALEYARVASRAWWPSANILNTLGVAQYRNCHFQEAIKTLTESARLRATESPTALVPPEDLAFLAMAYHQVGQKDKAQENLSRLREAMKQAKWAENEEARGFLREAEELLATPPAKKK